MEADSNESKKLNKIEKKKKKIAMYSKTKYFTTLRFILTQWKRLFSLTTPDKDAPQLG